MAVCFPDSGKCLASVTPAASSATQLPATDSCYLIGEPGFRSTNGQPLQRPSTVIRIKAMSTATVWKFLVRKPKSLYKQLFIKDRWVAARTLYGQTTGEDARTPSQLAKDFDLPLEAVSEAIAYCESNPPEIREDWEREQALIRAIGMDDPDQRASAKPRLLSPQDRARIGRT
jgi:uncharacterized protein (DUF433 family)